MAIEDGSWKTVQADRRGRRQGIGAGLYFATHLIWGYQIMDNRGESEKAEKKEGKKEILEGLGNGVFGTLKAKDADSDQLYKLYK